MDVAAAVELAVFTLGPAGVAALILWLGRSVGEEGAIRPSPGPTPTEPGWTEAMFTDGVCLYGRASSINRALIDPDAMARIRGFGYAPAED